MCEDGRARPGAPFLSITSATTSSSLADAGCGWVVFGCGFASATAFVNRLTAARLAPGYRVPATFDGEVPEFAFGAAERQWKIGECHDLSAMEVGAAGVLMTATVEDLLGVADPESLSGVFRPGLRDFPCGSAGVSSDHLGMDDNQPFRSTKAAAIESTAVLVVASGRRCLRSYLALQDSRSRVIHTTVVLARARLKIRTGPRDRQPS